VSGSKLPIPTYGVAWGLDEYSMNFNDDLICCTLVGQCG
jgi:hypothetical protein